LNLSRQVQDFADLFFFSSGSLLIVFLSFQFVFTAALFDLLLKLSPMPLRAYPAKLDCWSA